MGYGSISPHDEAGEAVSPQRKKGRVMYTLCGVLLLSISTALTFLSATFLMPSKYSPTLQKEVISPTSPPVQFEVHHTFPELTLPDEGTLMFGTYRTQDSNEPVTLGYRTWTAPKHIVVQSADVLNLTVNNHLPFLGPQLPMPAPNHSTPISMSPRTNFHLHGWHGSPDGNHDNVHRIFHSGSSYDVNLPLNDKVSTMVAHPHYHSTSVVDMVQGVLGTASVVTNDDPPTLILLSTLNLRSGVSRSVKGLHDLLQPVPGDLPPDTNYSSNTYLGNGISFRPTRPGPYPTLEHFLKSSSTLANGLVNPTVRLENPVRIVSATVGDTLHLDFGCPTDVIARDGVRHERRRVEGYLTLPPFSRADIIVLCPKNITEVEVKSVRSAQGDVFVGAKSDVDGNAERTIFTLLGKSENPIPDWQPPYDVDLRGTDVDNDYKWELSYDTFGKVKFHGASALASYGINGKSYPSTQFKACLDEVHEIKVINKYAVTHPFHMHTNHFQIVDYDCQGDGKCVNNDYKVGDWRDTVIVPSPGYVTIRFIPRDFIGKNSMMHCHIFGHEDLGMAAGLSIETC